MGAFKQMQLEEIENEEQQSVAQHMAAHQQFLHRMSQGRTPQRMVNQYQQELIPNQQPLEDELKEGVMAATISELIDMWVVRFGDTWVSEDTLQDDRFWVLASARLKATRNLETHSIFNQFKVVYRIIR